MNAFSTTIFFLAILHVFLTNVFRKRANQLGKTNLRVLYELLGNITLTFGLWLVPILIVNTVVEGFSSSQQLLVDVNFREPFAYFVLLTIASIHPIRKLFDTFMHRLCGRSLFVFWFGVILISSILTGIFSNVAIMALACWLLSSTFFKLRPSPWLSYCTLALLLVGISMGTAILPLNYGFFTNLTLKRAAFSEIFFLFGWKAFIAVSVIIFLVGLLFRGEFQKLQKTYSRQEKGGRVTLRELFYLLLFFVASFVQNQFYILLVILSVVVILHKPFYRKKGEERQFTLYLPIAIAFFTYTLEVQGSLQKWWVTPLFEQVQGFGSYWISYLLTGLNEHVPLGAMKEIWPTADLGTKFFAQLGIIAGGGLTVIATSANVISKLQLRKHFPHKTISPLYHLLVAAPIGLLASLVVIALHYLGGS